MRFILPSFFFQVSPFGFSSLSDFRSSGLNSSLICITTVRFFETVLQKLFFQFSALPFLALALPFLQCVRGGVCYSPPAVFPGFWGILASCSQKGPLSPCVLSKTPQTQCQAFTVAPEVTVAHLGGRAITWLWPRLRPAMANVH